MARMAEMVLSGSVPAQLLRSASTGKLSLPAGEMVEVLLLLGVHPDYSELARATLAAWDTTALKAVCADPATPILVLHHFLGPKNHQAVLLPALLENPAVTSATLASLADTASRELITAMVGSPRVRGIPEVLACLYVNRALEDSERQFVAGTMKSLGVEPPPLGTPFNHEADLWFLEHAAEIAVEGSKMTEIAIEPDEEAALAPLVEVSEADVLDLDEMVESTLDVRGEKKKLSTLQKLNKMNVAQRIKVAMLGNSEQRNILVRDGSRMVYSAVLASPKLAANEVESFAGLKNVQQGVLREIARNRKYMKNYGVIKNLCSNPRSPMDISLPLLKNLLAPDLKVLSMNKNVPETLRKLAIKAFKEKTAPPGSKSE